MAAQSVVRLGLESNQYERGIRQARQSFNEFTKGIGAGALKMSAVGAAVTATTAALKVAKDAFGANERYVDEWGRTLESAKNVYQGFLHALNTGDISGYLSNINAIVAAARRAYDEIDALGSMKTIQSPEIAKQQSENERFRNMIRTRRYIAPAGGSGLSPSMKAGDLLSDAQVRALEKQLQSGMNKIVTLWGNETKQSAKAIDAEYERLAMVNGMSKAEFQKGTSSWTEFNKRVEMAQKYREWENKNSYVDQTTGRLVSSGGRNPYAAYKGWDVFRVDGDDFNKLGSLIKQREAQVQQIYSSQAQAYGAINRAEGITSRIGGRSGSSVSSRGGGVQTGPLQALQLEMMNGLTPTGYLPTGNAVGSVAGMSAWFDQNMFGKGLQDQARQFGWYMMDKGNGPSRSEKMLGALDEVVGAMSKLSGGLEDMGIKLPKSLNNLLTGINGLITVIQAVQAAKEGIELIKALFLSGGGVVHAASGVTVPGNLLSGDRVPAMLNSGEVVLNRAEVGNIASQLQGAGGGPTGQSGTSIVTAEDIVVVLNNWGQRNGVGKLVFS